MGDPDLSPADRDAPPRLVRPDRDAPRGLVVFPKPERPPRRTLGWYAPFLATVAVGAIVVVVVVLVR